MNNFKGTPGPWQWDQDGGALRSKTHILLCPGNVPGGIDTRDGWGALLGAFAGDDDESEANAKLIAAAPDLLEALQAIIARLDPYDYPDEQNMARAAIAKALASNT